MEHSEIEEITPRSWLEAKKLITEFPRRTIRNHRLGSDRNFYVDEYRQFIDQKGVLEWRKRLIESTESGIIIVPNNFPYSRMLVHLPFVKHFVLWSKSQLKTEEIIQALEDFFDPFDFEWYENSTNQQSIPEIFHVQVFVNFENSDVMLTFFDSEFPNN